MLEIKAMDSLIELNLLKKQYFSRSTSPLDGMWHFGFVPMAKHFGFYENNILVGYCCVNDDGYMLQFYVSPIANIMSSELFALIAQGNISAIKMVKGAFVSTAEPDYFSLCLDNSSGFKVNALMYQEAGENSSTSKQLVMTLAQQAQLNDFVEFAVTAIGAPEQWLTGYFDKLITRQELWGYWQNEQLLASGECRLFDDYQTQYADLGMIVSASERGKGIGTAVLHHLKSIAKTKSRLSICSTERNNIGAQKAISRAGLVSGNRIVQFEFSKQ